ncbi:MAG: hypothetical protein RLT05_36975 [Bauldia litoralis]
MSGSTRGNTVTSDKPIRAQLITGDINEQYQMRWYSLTPTEKWSDGYYAPVAEEVGSTGFWFYNPGATTITTVSFQSMSCASQTR